MLPKDYCKEDPLQLSKGPAVLKTLRDSKLLRRSVFTTPPFLLRCKPFFERKNACNSQGKWCPREGVAIVNHCAVVNLLRIVNLLRRSVFSTAGSFGNFPWGGELARSWPGVGQLLSNSVRQESFEIIWPWEVKINLKSKNNPENGLFVRLLQAFLRLLYLNTPKLRA